MWIRKINAISDSEHEDMTPEQLLDGGFCPSCNTSLNNEHCDSCHFDVEDTRTMVHAWVSECLSPEINLGTIRVEKEQVIISLYIWRYNNQEFDVVVPYSFHSIKNRRGWEFELKVIDYGIDFSAVDTSHIPNIPQKMITCLLEYKISELQEAIYKYHSDL